MLLCKTVNTFWFPEEKTRAAGGTWLPTMHCSIVIGYKMEDGLLAGGTLSP